LTAGILSLSVPDNRALPAAKIKPMESPGKTGRFLVVFRRLFAAGSNTPPFRAVKNNNPNKKMAIDPASK
jgi:hypothetical protein